MTPESAPALTIVIASRDRCELLTRCLDSLRTQTQSPESFEVIVADDGSADGTADAVERLDSPFRLRLLRLDRGGKAAALNAALRAAEGTACLFLDDDLIAAPGLVAEHVAAHREAANVLGIGKLVQAAPEGRDAYARVSARRWNERYEELAERGVDWADCYGANFSAPRGTLLEVGGFATDLAAVEDLEIAFRLSRAGCVAQYLPRAEALHDDRKPGRLVLAHEQRFGTVCTALVQRHPGMRRRLLGWFKQPTVREVTLRRLLLGLRVPPAALARLGRLVPGRGRRRVWFGFVSRYAFWFGVRRGMSRSDWRQATGGVPVLMYHGFTDSGEEDRYILPQASFARQMRILAALRYRVIRFEDLARALRQGEPLPRRTVAITIDDGYRDNFEIAYPILRRRGFPATLFLVSRRLGGHNDWNAGGLGRGRALLSVDQVRRMRADGFDAGAHTRTHPKLPGLAAEELDSEVAGAREDLERALGAPVETFAYPYGRLDARAVAAVDRASFLGACTTEGGHARLGDDPLLIPRVEVRGSDQTGRFLRKLWFGV